MNSKPNAITKRKQRIAFLIPFIVRDADNSVNETTFPLNQISSDFDGKISRIAAVIAQTGKRVGDQCLLLGTSERTPTPPGIDVLADYNPTFVGTE